VILAGQALFTFREALIGFTAGGLLGLLLGIGFVHSRLAERAFVPYVVASQTVPILAISPLIVVATKAGWVSVAIISAYLTFFPVTIAALRGLRAADPRAFELMRSYAATKRSVLWKLRLPTSVPYLFASLRVAAAAAGLGAIIGELPSGIPDGLGSALLNYNQYYTSGPERLWATIIMCSILGLAFVGLVRLAETLLTRNRYRPVAAA
jgi:NitT/TauT family transport system permease protein